jgi:hypothetical protein
MYLVSVTVEAGPIRARAAALRRTGSAGVQLQVHLEDHRGTEVSSVEDVLTAALDAHRTGAHALYPMAGGLWVVVPGETKWKVVVDAVAGALEDAGVTATLSASPLLDIDTFLAQKPVTPTVFAAFTMASPLADLPVNPHGVPEFRWGVDPAVTDRAFASTLDWLAGVDGEMELRGAGPLLPMDAVGGPAVLRASTGYADQWLVAHALGQGPGQGQEHYRAVHFAHWGQVTCTEVASGRPAPRTAESLLKPITELASSLDTAAVWLANPLFPSWSSLPHGPQWILRRDLWDSHVLDVAGIQLLSSDQLDRASDLAAWSVERVSDDRWLVSSKDLGAWYDAPDPGAWGQGRFPEPAMVAAARADFGELVIQPEAL